MGHYSHRLCISAYPLVCPAVTGLTRGKRIPKHKNFLQLRSHTTFLCLAYSLALSVCAPTRTVHTMVMPEPEETTHCCYGMLNALSAAGRAHKQRSTSSGELLMESIYPCPRTVPSKTHTYIHISNCEPLSSLFCKIVELTLLRFTKLTLDHAFLD